MSVRATSKIIGMGSSEKHRGDAKHIKYGKRSLLSTENTDKQFMNYTKSRIDKAKNHDNLGKNE